MKGLIIKYLLLVKSNIKSLLIVFCVFIFMATQGSFNIGVGLPIMCVMLFISTFSYDDYNNWNAYAITLPCGKENIVKSKYITISIIIVVSLIVSIIVSTITSIVNKNLDFSNVLSSCMSGILSTIILISVMYPLIFKYGVEKGRIYLFIILFALTALSGLLMNKIKTDTIIDFVNKNSVLVLIVTLFILIAFIFVSYKISKSIYLKREF